MKRLTSFFAAATLALAGIGLAARDPANASNPSSVTITLLRTLPDYTPSTWSSTGAIVASGTWSADRFVCGACPAPTTGAFNFFTTETVTGGGSFEMRFVREFNQSEAVDRWWIVDGTGAYAKLRGQGTFTVTRDSSFVYITCVGDVSLG